MPGPSIDLEMRLRDNKVQMGLDALAAAEKKNDDGFRNIAKSAKQADAELSRFASRTKEIVSTPLEKYNRQVFLLDQALKRNKLGHEEHARAIRLAGREFDLAGNRQSSFLTGAVSQLTALTTGYLSLQAAVSGASAVMNRAREDAQGAIGSVRGLDETRRELLGVSSSDADYQASLKEADAAARRFGVKRADSQHVKFETKSFGLDSEYGQIMAMHPVIPATIASRLAGKAGRMFDEKLSPRQIANMTIAAARPSEADAPQFADALAAAMEGGQRIGMTPAEAMSILSVSAAHYAARGMGEGGGAGAVRVAGHRASAFAHKVSTRLPELGEHITAIEAFKAIEKMSPEERADFLKENEEVGGFYAMMRKELPAMETLRDELDRKKNETGGNDELAVLLKRHKESPIDQASLKVRQAEIDEEIAREAKAPTAADRDASVREANAAAFRRDATAAEREGVRRAGDFAQGIEASPLQTRALTDVGGYAGRTLGYGGLNIQFDIFNRMLQKMEEQGIILQDIRDGNGRGGGASSRPAMAEATSTLN